MSNDNEMYWSENGVRLHIRGGPPPRPQLQFQRVHPDAILPQRKHEWDAGLDLAVLADTAIKSGESALVRTGLKVAIPEHYVGLVFERSSFNRNTGCSFTNKVGVVDATYRGELFLTVHNGTENTVWLHKADRVGQLVVTPILVADAVEVDSLDETVRGEGGFGSTGVGSNG